MALRLSTPVVCFDLGGVLLRIRRSWDESAVDAGYKPPDGGPYGLNSFGPLIEYQAGTLSEGDYLEALGGWFGLEAIQARQIHQAIVLSDYPGAFELVQDLKAAGIYTCCFSNTNNLHWPVLSDPGLHPAIAALDRRFASHELGMTKPEPDSFTCVEEQFPAHSEVIFFEDTPENVLGAANAGWRAFRIDPEDDPVRQIRQLLGKLKLPLAA